MSCFTLSYFTQLLQFVPLIVLLSARSAGAKLLIVLSSSAYFKYILFDAEHKHLSCVFLRLSDTSPAFSEHTLNQNISAVLVLYAPKLYPLTTARAAFIPDSRVGTPVRMGSTFVAANWLDCTHVQKPSGWPARKPDAEVRGWGGYRCGLAVWMHSQISQKRHWRQFIIMKWTFDSLAESSGVMFDCLEIVAIKLSWEIILVLMCAKSEKNSLYSHLWLHKNTILVP